MKATRERIILQKKVCDQAAPSSVLDGMDTRVYAGSGLLDDGRSREEIQTG
jgi:hypothetical protein